MTIELFRQFLALSEYLNFSAAAESLFITQSALSRHITALEASLDTKLFDRTTQSVSLTPAGVLFRERITTLLRDYEDVCSRLRIMKAGFDHRLRIGVPYYAIRDYLGPTPEIFERTYPAIKLQYSVGDPYEVIKALCDSKVDIAILPQYPVSSSEKIVFEPVYEERLGVLLPSGDPLAQKPELSLRDLKDKTFFSIDNHYFSASWNHTVSLCKAAGFTPHAPAVFNQMEALIMAIRRGDGLTVIGRHMRNQETDLIVYRPLIEKDCERAVCICHKAENEEAPILKFTKLYKNIEFSRD